VSYLHDEVEGEIEEQVADENSQQITGKVRWVINGAVQCPAKTEFNHKMLLCHHERPKK
jgi:hypothetical protein